jgi:hypothetical protein
VHTGLNNIVANWAKPFADDLNASKRALGIKHNRTQLPRKSKAKLVFKNGIVSRVSISMTRGEIFTHKGVGRGGNRHHKEWYNPIADKEVKELAEQIALECGDYIGSHIFKI